MVKVLWRFEGYITSIQSGFSMNKWVHVQGTVEVFRAITTREQAVKNEKNDSPKERGKRTHKKKERNILTKRMRKTYSPKTYSPKNVLTKRMRKMYSPKSHSPKRMRKVYSPKE